MTLEMQSLMRSLYAVKIVSAGLIVLGAGGFIVPQYSCLAPSTASITGSRPIRRASWRRRLNSRSPAERARIFRAA